MWPSRPLESSTPLQFFFQPLQIDQVMAHFYSNLVPTRVGPSPNFPLDILISPLLLHHSLRNYYVCHVLLELVQRSNFFLIGWKVGPYSWTLPSSLATQWKWALPKYPLTTEFWCVKVSFLKIRVGNLIWWMPTNNL